MSGQNFFDRKSYDKGYSRDQLIKMYWSGHPRFRFVKGCPENARFLDIGAGSGGLAFWKAWAVPKRADLKFYGIDLSVGEHADLYERFDGLNLDESAFPYEDNFFDAIYSTHVLEHLRRPQAVLKEMCRVLKPGGMCYIEVPNHNTVNVPSMNEFKEQGFVTTTMNFYDDKTHLTPYSNDELKELLGSNVKVLESGTIQNPYLAEMLISYGYQRCDQEITTYGLWLKTLWSDYVLGIKSEG